MADFRRVLMIVLAIMLAPFALCYAAMYLMFIVPENNIRQSLNLYPEATAVFEDSALYGADVDRKSLYYWTQSPITDVQKHYEGIYQPFTLSTDEYGNWLISAYYLNGSIPKADTNSSYLSHSSFCSDFRDFECVSVALVDSKQAHLYQLPVTSPSIFRRNVSPHELTNLPHKGTLIIYSYWLNGL